MAQRTHTPLHTGDESPSCGVCSRRARLKLTAPTATLDTPRPISSTESTNRLPMIWLLVHILLGSSFLSAQRRKPIIHFPSSKVLLSPFHPQPQSRYSNFSLFTTKTLSTRSGFPEPEKQRFCGQARKSCSNPWHVHTATAGDGWESKSQHWGAGLWRARQFTRRCTEFCCIWFLGSQELPGTSQASFCFPAEEASFVS